ncbi:hypothetical protein SAMN05444156_1614 [Verrucomicrobium sp. GAS474]|uniref:hypothetical protein n=1 Tax=Verrucomicrobium sp. GAS474 TaxID=1882831 RepID=UPI000879F39C|nr:hypothetical protein [Verrucomicrobium sp. GAS474]SDU04106.1 hypothetical protein SAMN05444156_1614 [Verrucomicrobium sp. GAS474]
MLTPPEEALPPLSLKAVFAESFRVVGSSFRTAPQVLLLTLLAEGMVDLSWHTGKPLLDGLQALVFGALSFVMGIAIIASLLPLIRRGENRWILTFRQWDKLARFCGLLALLAVFLLLCGFGGVVVGVLRNLFHWSPLVLKGFSFLLLAGVVLVPLVVWGQSFYLLVDQDLGVFASLHHSAELTRGARGTITVYMALLLALLVPLSIWAKQSGSIWLHGLGYLGSAFFCFAGAVLYDHLLRRAAAASVE